MNTRSLKFRLSLWYAAWSAIGILLVAVFVYAGLKQYLERELISLLSRRVQRIAEVTHRSGGDWELMRRDVKEFFAPEANNRYLRITTGDRELYLSGPPADDTFEPAQVAAARAQGQRRSLPDGDVVFVQTTQTVVAGAPLVIEFGSSAEPMRQVLREWVVAVVIGLALLIPGAVAGAYHLVRRALKPVDEMIATARRITSKGTGERLPVPQSGDEIQRLSESLNALIDRLEQSLQHSQRFQADASHELRTPLMVVQTELEALRERVADVEARALAGSALTELGRLQVIVDDLLALARLDAGEPQVWETVNLSALLHSTVEQMSLLAADKGISVTIRASSPALVQGDPGRLKQVIVNLLDNAIKYTPGGGSILAEVLVENGKAVLRVSDTGIGISEQALPHIFDRFYRADQARSRPGGGAGLGLSIVQAISRTHGADVQVRSAPGRGTCFSVAFPLEKEEAGQ